MLEEIEMGRPILNGEWSDWNVIKSWESERKCEKGYKQWERIEWKCGKSIHTVGRGWSGPELSFLCLLHLSSSSTIVFNSILILFHILEDDAHDGDNGEKDKDKGDDGDDTNSLRTGLGGGPACQDNTFCLRIQLLLCQAPHPCQEVQWHHHHRHPDCHHHNNCHDYHIKNHFHIYLPLCIMNRGSRSSSPIWSSSIFWWIFTGASGWGDHGM